MGSVGVSAVALLVTASAATAATAATALGAGPSLFASPKAHTRAPRVLFAEGRALLTASAPGIEGPALPALGAEGTDFVTVVNPSTNHEARLCLYDADGAVDRAAARTFMRVAGRTATTPEDAGDDDERLDLRLVQLAIRTAVHFGGASIRVISSSRPGARGKHGTGEALDFALEGVAASVLATYLRDTPRAGVGHYTHPKTQYVHLDVREQSCHWTDASPPGITWREKLLQDPKRAERDASWSPALDLPERR